MTRILIVDEDTDVLRLLRVKLQAAGYQINQARDGKEALDLVGKDKPDLVLMELLLPDIKGLELISQIKNNINPAPLVVILTSEDSDNAIVGAFSAGAVDYLTKPFSPQVLLERIRINLIREKLVAVTEMEG